jgi:hypothetical protein
MQTSRKLSHALLALFALAVMAASAFAQGAAYPQTSAVSDQKAGSVLFYNYYTSDAANPGARNTRINITNTSTTSTAVVHLFFVQQTDCTAADNFICLTANQTASFLTSDVDPNTSGFIVAVAADQNGCPAPFNFLIGDEYVKTPTHAANLGAEAFAALFSRPVCPAPDSNQVVLNFNGVESLTAANYNQAPRVLALDNFASPADGNNTLLIINTVGGDLGGTVPSVGQVFMLVYDDAENPGSATLTLPRCQNLVTVNNAGIRTAPPILSLVPSGRSGWLKFYSTNPGRAILGASINANAETGFSGGHNLHKLTLVPSVLVTIPIFPPACGD